MIVFFTGIKERIFSLFIDIKKKKSEERKRGKRKEKVRTNIANTHFVYTSPSLLLSPPLKSTYTFMGEIYVTYTLSKAGNC